MSNYGSNDANQYAYSYYPTPTATAAPAATAQHVVAAGTPVIAGAAATAASDYYNTQGYGYWPTSSTPGYTAYGAAPSYYTSGAGTVGADSTAAVANQNQPATNSAYQGQAATSSSYQSQAAASSAYESQAATTVAYQSEPAANTTSLNNKPTPTAVTSNYATRYVTFEIYL
jgi:hypothetical protein